MSVGAKRYIGGTLGFAFAAIWVTTGFTAALTCAAAAGLGYGAVRLSERGSLGGLLGARDTVGKELRGRLAAPPRTARPAKRPPQQARRPVREQAPAPIVVEPATYGW